MGDEAIEEIEHFTYLGIVVVTHGMAECDVKTRISKANVAFLQLKNIFLQSKIRIFNTNVKADLIYAGAETRRTRVATTNSRIQTSLVLSVAVEEDSLALVA